MATEDHSDLSKAPALRWHLFLYLLALVPFAGAPVIMLASLIGYRVLRARNGSLSRLVATHGLLAVVAAAAVTTAWWLVRGLRL